MFSLVIVGAFRGHFGVVATGMFVPAEERGQSSCEGRYQHNTDGDSGHESAGVL